MTRRQIHRLPGMRDVTAHTYERMSQAMGELRTHFGSSGYEVIETPLLEETELFVRKSGGELTNRLYTFTDPGGHRVSLRPEFTSSVIRRFIQEQNSLSVPVRWQYGGPVFRYEGVEGETYRQFTQVGAELVGAAEVEADAEIIYLAWSGLQEVGLRDCRLRIGHLGLLHSLLSAHNLSEPAKLFIISNVQDLKRGRTNVSALRQRAEDVGLLRVGFDQSIGTALDGISLEAAQEFIQSALKDSMPAPVGQRTTEQIVARLLRKVRIADDPDVFEEALTLISLLAQLEGPPQFVLDEARSVALERGMKSGSFDELDKLVNALASRGVSEDGIALDLGLAMGIAYYTGVVFELHSLPTKRASLGGGGRYDSLVKALGGEEDVPALGFAYNMDEVLGALEDVNATRSEASVS